MKNENNCETSNKENLYINESINKNSPLIQLPPPSIMIPSLSVCKIDNSMNKIGSGYFIKFFKGEEDFFCLMTNEHIISSKLINEKKTINLYYNYETKLKLITLDSKERYIKEFTEIGIDATIVQILPEDNIENIVFLLPDLKYMNSFQEIINKEITIIQYPLGEKLSYSEHKIIKIKKFEFTHFASIQSCSSGSPVFLKDSTRVIGIHKGTKRDNSENYGDFIGPIFNFIKNNFKYNIINLDNGDCYFGELNNNIKNGKGILYYDDDTIKYDGFFVSDKFEGFGKYIEKNGQYYIGEWKDNLKDEGKEYDSYGDLIFEGKYINGKRGKGKEYDSYGDLIFEGEYLNGKKWNGNIKIKYEDKVKWERTIIFEGEIINGMRRRGKGYNTCGGLIFEGEYLDGLRWNGKGKEEWDGKILFEGEYFNGKQWNGKVMDYFIHLNSIGEILNGKRHGYWRIYCSGKLFFEGEYLNGEKNGKGIEYYSDGKLECIYVNGVINGIAKKYYENGALKFEGEYLNGEKNGKGKEYYENGALK